jgi:hypothetical protein
VSVNVVVDIDGDGDGDGDDERRRGPTWTSEICGDATRVRNGVAMPKKSMHLRATVSTLSAYVIVKV